MGLRRAGMCLLAITGILVLPVSALSQESAPTLKQRVLNEAIARLPVPYQEQLQHRVILIDNVRHHFSSTNVPERTLKVLESKAAFSLGTPAAFPIYVRTTSNVFARAMADARRVPDRLSLSTDLLAGVLIHELAHVLLNASESDALALEIKALEDRSRADRVGSAGARLGYAGRLATLRAQRAAATRRPASAEKLVAGSSDDVECVSRPSCGPFSPICLQPENPTFACECGDLAELCSDYLFDPGNCGDWMCVGGQYCNCCIEHEPGIYDCIYYY